MRGLILYIKVLSLGSTDFIILTHRQKKFINFKIESEKLV